MICSLEGFPRTACKIQRLLLQLPMVCIWILGQEGGRKSAENRSVDRTESLL